MKKQLLLFVMMLLPMVASAYDFMVGGIRYNILSAEDKTVEVTYDHQEGAAFYGEYTGDIIVPSEVTYNNITFRVSQIGDYAFKYCKKLNSVTVKEGVTSIGSEAISSGSVTKIYLPNSIFTMSRSTFGGNWYLIDVHLPEYIQSLPEDLFRVDKAIETVELPKNIREIPIRCFYECESLKNIDIPTNVQKINSSAFDGCKNLVSISLPEKVTEIGSYAFLGCSSLQEIHFLRSDIKCGNSAFNNCSSLKSIFVHDTNVCGATLVFTEGTYLFATLYVPKGTKALYQNANGWKNFSNIEEFEGAGGEGTGETETKKCEKPTISYTNGQLSFASDTEGAEFVTEITDSDIKRHYDANIQLTATYTISVYARKSGYDNSDVATATLCWIDVEPLMEGDINGIAQVAARPVLVKTDNGFITVEGIDDQTDVSVYTVDGKLAGTAVSHNNKATIATSIKPGSIAIVKVGDKSVKVLMK